MDLQLALELARKRLAQFEQKYGVSSEYFITTMVAEDLEGEDEAYIHWAGEYKLMQRLEEKLNAKGQGSKGAKTDGYHSNLSYTFWRSWWRICCWERVGVGPKKARRSR